MTQRQFAAPHGLSRLLSWLLSEWGDEIPMRLHVRGVWHDKTGASLLGAPQMHASFRAFLLDSASAVDAMPGEDERGAVYVRPVHRALARMVGPHYGDRLDHHMSVRSYMGRYLFALACSGGDWTGMAARFGIPPQVAPIYTEQALWRLWSEYEREPEVRAIA